MSVWVVVGGQYGSEGKGKIAAFITLREKIDICVRSGGPNAGHCVMDNEGNRYVLRQISTGFIRPETRLLTPAGGLIDLGVLKSEIDFLGLGPNRVGVDFRASIITEEDKETENRLDLRNQISSTLCGVGAATSRRVLRTNPLLAEEAANTVTWLKPYLTDSAAELNEGVNFGRKILVEGSQGFGLSLYHSPHYPKATSRDTSASGCISECGISPMLVTNVVMVVRTFPIRVAGQQAGPLYEETDWETIRKDSGYDHSIAETTTVTKKTRRVGRFNFSEVNRAVLINRPTELAVNFLDYLSVENCEARSYRGLTENAKQFLHKLKTETGVSSGYVGVGPKIGDTFYAREFQD